MSPAVRGAAPKKRSGLSKVVAFVERNHRAVSALLVAVAAAWVLALPAACISCGEAKVRGTYFSENALQVQSSRPGFSKVEAAWAEDAARRWARQLGDPERSGWGHKESSRVCEDASAAEVALAGLRNASALWFRDELAALGFEVAIQPYGAGQGSRRSWNVVAVVRGTGSTSGAEAMLLGARYPVVLPPAAEAAPVALGRESNPPGGAFVLLAVARYLARVKWLSKDVVLLFGGGSLDGCTLDAHRGVCGSDDTVDASQPQLVAGSSKPTCVVTSTRSDKRAACTVCPTARALGLNRGCGAGSEVGAASRPDDVAAWVNSVIASNARSETHWGSCRDRACLAGAVRAAVVLDMPHRRSVGGVALVPQGEAGALPNLDLVNTAIAAFAGRFSLHGGSLRNDGVTISAPDDGHAWLQNAVDGAASRVASALGPLLGTGRSSAAIYAHRLGATARFAWRMVVGPWAPHAPLVGAGIDALTVSTVSSGTSGANGKRQRARQRGATGSQDVTVRVGRGVEVIVRAVSNLDERLHQSFWLYLMPDAHTFVSVGEYCYPAGIFVCVLALTAAVRRVRMQAVLSAAACLAVAWPCAAAAQWASRNVDTVLWARLTTLRGCADTDAGVNVAAIGYVAGAVAVAAGAEVACVRVMRAMAARVRHVGAAADEAVDLPFVCCVVGISSTAAIGIVNFPLGLLTLALLAPMVPVVVGRPARGAGSRLTGTLWLAATSPAGLTLAAAAGSAASWYFAAVSPGAASPEAAAAAALHTVLAGSEDTYGPATDGGSHPQAWMTAPLVLWFVWFPLHAGLTVHFRLRYHTGKLAASDLFMAPVALTGGGVPLALQCHSVQDYSHARLSTTSKFNPLTQRR